MASTFATMFQDKARALLWNAHSEELTVRWDGVTPATLRGVWKRVQPDGVQAPDGQGLTTYLGQALITVRKADLTDITHLAKAEITRDGEVWTVRHAESQDAWTWVLHLSRRKANARAPR